MNTYLATYKSADESKWFKSLIEAPNYQEARVKATAKAQAESLTYCTIDRINRSGALWWIEKHGRDKLAQEDNPIQTAIKSAGARLPWEGWS